VYHGGEAPKGGAAMSNIMTVFSVIFSALNFAVGLARLVIAIVNAVKKK